MTPVQQRQFNAWWRFVTLSYLGAAMAAVIGFVFPGSVGSSLGTTGTAFLAITILVPLVTTLAVATRRARFPTITFVAIVPFMLPAIASSLAGQPLWVACLAILLMIMFASMPFAFGNWLAATVLLALVAVVAASAMYARTSLGAVPHAVRTIDDGIGIPDCSNAAADSGPSSARCRSSLTQEVNAWRAGRAPASDAMRYVVFVAAAGGGLRAAYWTAAVLGRLHDCIGDFGQDVFAISGVSGGALGAALYDSLLHDALASGSAVPEMSNCDHHPLAISDTKVGAGWMQTDVHAVLGRDFLAPITASLIFRDLPQSFNPATVLEDRAGTLELGIEQAWRDACSKRSVGPECANANEFGESFFKLRAGPGWLPVLLLNGTHQETGKRIITSKMRIDRENFLDVYDFFDLAEQDVRLSTAVINSGRFPFISPAGAIVRRMANGDTIEIRGHVIDGGFFENNGAVSIQQLARATLKELSRQTGDDTWTPIIIEILNDVSTSTGDLERSTGSAFADQGTSTSTIDSGQWSVANQLTSAFNGLYETRNARGVLASKALADFARQNQGTTI